MSRIRPATPVDAKGLAHLRYTLRSKPHDNESESAFLERCQAWMTTHLEEPNWRAWVLEEDDRIIGALWLQLIEKIPNPTAESERMAYITNVFVNEDARGNGLGSSLLSTAVEFCKRENIETIFLWPSERSRSLYQRHGFAVREDLMELELE